MSSGALIVGIDFVVIVNWYKIVVFNNLALDLANILERC
jgi:hypothetical protein